MRRDSYARIAAPILGMIAVMAGIAVSGRRPPATKPLIPPPLVQLPPTPAKVSPSPLVAMAPSIDAAAIAKANAGLIAARSEADLAAKRAVEAATRLASAQAQGEAAATALHAFTSAANDHSGRVAAARAEGERIQLERDSLRGELMALSEAPRPRRKVLIDKSPVAKKAEGEEFHFEIRGDRVAFIDVERLLDKVKTDARVKIRLNNGVRPASGTVGPIGAFEMSYEVERIDDGLNPRVGNFGLSAWEIVPVHASRGERLEAALGPASDFARAIRRLNPSRDVVTMWIYPDGFVLYRKLRETLHAQGFLVAARPLPEGSTIRGSPAGSASSAQ